MWSGMNRHHYVESKAILEISDKMFDEKHSILDISKPGTDYSIDRLSLVRSTC